MGLMDRIEPNAENQWRAQTPADKNLAERVNKILDVRDKNLLSVLSRNIQEVTPTGTAWCSWAAKSSTSARGTGGRRTRSASASAR